MRANHIQAGVTACVLAISLSACGMVQVQVGASPTEPPPPATAVVAPPTIPPPTTAPPTVAPTLAPRPTVAAQLPPAAPEVQLRPTQVVLDQAAPTPDSLSGGLIPPSILKVPANITGPTSTPTHAPATATPKPAAPTAAPPSPTAAQSASGAKVILRDDFKNPASGFKTYSTGDVGQYGYGDGFFFMKMIAFTGTNAQSSWAISQRETPELTDFALTVDVQLDAAKTDGAYSVLFRWRDFDNYYKFSVDPNTGNYTLFRLTKNQQTKLIDWKTSGEIQRGASKNTLGVLARGQDIAVYANGVLLGSVKDGGFSSGKIAFMVNAWHDPFTARFTNLLITEPPK
jgi:hypothetical protein